MTPIIKVENLSKRYRIGQREAYRTFREAFTDTLYTPFRRIRSAVQRSDARRENGSNSIWALKDVSFEVSPGEVVGIIGRNGAGKSTLLKILSRITEPTSGKVDLYGRVASLLEVGTGFHPELTGRENVYLNGAILGMQKSEIARKFDRIVEFAEIEKFLDTPVKRYSSGMYVRLAFAVAVHLEPEILVVDEVLAVGDLSFQQKCLNHMRSLTSSGMTILLVSHNMAAIQSSCSGALLLDTGAIKAEGSPLDVIESYRRSLQQGALETGSGTIDGNDQRKAGVNIVGFEMFGEDGTSRRNFNFGEAVRIRIDIYSEQRIEYPLINFGIKRGDGVIVCNFNNWYDNFKLDYIEGECSLEGWLPPLRLVPDYYEAHVLVWPWGGGHLEGDMTRSMPLAATTFGDFQINGPGLNAHDGVFQMPARKWQFQRGDRVIEYADMTPNSLQEAFIQDNLS